MRSRLADDNRETTIVDPPPVQEMNAKSKQESASSSMNDAENRLAIQPV